ncbi:MAG: O-antigen polysaccharide polymerase Wzy [Lachnospiraceae bacterium]|nr:O-antigen polysaccharide polymerase Wzy [Lachnospiraceae bacterium]
MYYNKNQCVYKTLFFISAVVNLIVLLLTEDIISSWETQITKTWIFVYGWLGIILIILMIFSWREKTGTILSPYMIFMAFFMVFNYGQFLMWALGIHYQGELGTTKWIRYMDPVTLLRIAMIVMTYASFFHLGALIIEGKKETKYDIFIGDAEWFIWLILGISYAIQMYSAVMNLRIARIYGYQALYYGDYVVEIEGIWKYISYFFFPALMAYWISKDFSAKSFKVVIGIMTPYMVINLLAGDRGSWFYYVLILIWVYLAYIKQPKTGTILRLGILGAMVLIITSILVKYREIGYQNITAENIGSVLGDLSYTFIKPFFEMGQSARVLGILIQDNLHEKWSYGNTYVSGILAMVLPRIKMWFGYPDFYLDNWISQTYMNLSNYGLGFTITAEAYLNGGEFFGSFIMMVLGMFFGRILNVTKENMYDKMHMFVVFSSAGCFLPLPRGSCELMLRKWFWGCIVLGGILYLISFKQRKSAD